MMMGSVRCPRFVTHPLVPLLVGSAVRDSLTARTHWDVRDHPHRETGLGVNDRRACAKGRHYLSHL